MTSLSNRKIWLVGASVGIGEALARELSEQGAIVACSARSEDKLSALINALSGEGHLALTLDVTDDTTIEKAWAVLTVRWGIPDMVIYNAGTYEAMGAAAFNLKKAEAMVDVNFSGCLRVLSRILPAFISRNAGHIVLVGSVAGYSGLPNAIGYGASKAAIIHLAENLRVDLSASNITVQLVSPGFVKTRLTDKNTFPMPFMLTVQDAAKRIVKGIISDSFEITFPKRLSYPLKFLRLLPYKLYFAFVKRAIIKE